MSGSLRPRRVAETIRKHVAEALAREVFDPRLAGIMLTRVDIASDLAVAHIHFRVLGGPPDEAARKVLVKAANHAAPALRRGLGVRLATKRTPNLNFYYDLGQDAVDRVEELLGEIAEENAGRPPE